MTGPRADCAKKGKVALHEVSQLRLSSVTPDFVVHNSVWRLVASRVSSECYLSLLGSCVARGAATVGGSSVVSTYLVYFSAIKQVVLLSN